MSTNPKARAWVQVRADALRENYARVRDAVGSQVGVLPMVKANAYGLGVREVVACLDRLDPWGFGVATVDEGCELRGLGVTRPVLVCSPAPVDQFDEALHHDLQLSISSVASLEALTHTAERAGTDASFHVDVDTGMGRSGFDWREADVWLPAVTAASGSRLHWAGCYTHLHSADEDEASIARQWKRFETVLDRLGSDHDGLVHVLNSAGLFRSPDRARALVRPGIFLYGGEIGAGQPSPDPVVSIHARIVHTREVPPGTTLGYGATYASDGDERWATLSIGYGDGLPRALGNRGSAIVEGVRVPIIGRISMDVTVVDITGVSAVREGSVATLLGEQGRERITLDEIAESADTISYEVLTGLTGRLPRVWA